MLAQKQHDLMQPLALQLPELLAWQGFHLAIHGCSLHSVSQDDAARLGGGGLVGDSSARADASPDLALAVTSSFSKPMSASAWNWRCSRASRSTEVVARTVAARRAPWSSASSPKWSPAFNCASFSSPSE